MRGGGQSVGFGGGRRAAVFAFFPQTLVIVAGHPAVQSWVHSSAVRGSVWRWVMGRRVSLFERPRGRHVGVRGGEMWPRLASRRKRAVGLSVRGRRWRFANEGPPLALCHAVLVRAHGVRLVERGFAFSQCSGVRGGRPLCFPEARLLLARATDRVFGPPGAWLSRSPTEFTGGGGGRLATPGVLWLTVWLAGGGTLWVWLLAWSVGRVEGSLERGGVVTSCLQFGMLGNGGWRGGNSGRLCWGTLGLRFWRLRYFSVRKKGKWEVTYGSFSREEMV